MLLRACAPGRCGGGVWTLWRTEKYPTKMTMGWRDDAGDPVYRADCGMSPKSRDCLPCRDGDGVVAVVGG